VGREVPGDCRTAGRDVTGATEATTTWRVMGLSLGLDEPEAALRERALERAGLAEQDVRGLRIAHKALDARRRGGRRSLRFVVHVDLMLEPQHSARASHVFRQAAMTGRLVQQAEPGSLRVSSPHDSLRGARVVVVGAGPAGLFAALSLARSGVRVDLLDRGPELMVRSRALARFLRRRELDSEANLLFGEGGAGAYSDGKIYTRVDHPLELPILEELIACGAPPEIAYDARAHIGTDRLHKILPRLRARLEEAGVHLHWQTRLEGWDAREGDARRVTSLRTARGEIPCDAVFLALGHSARDTLPLLIEGGLSIESKPFQIGVRIEHPQSLIDTGRYGDATLHETLGAAYYGLRSRAGAGAPACHSFCMCPGGQIVASVNAPGLLCTNGMSNSRHSSPYANAALVTTLGPQELGEGPLAGLRYQEQLERAFFEAGGHDWTAPAQRAPDFLAGRESSGNLHSSYQLGLCAGRIDALLPTRIRDALRRGLAHFDRQIPGYAGSDALLVGIESRSSSPIRMPRSAESGRAKGFTNVFPIGEGAGYAGGIMSAAIDGAKIAQLLLSDGL
jgi:uncharacterized FAD-dependent dehydrogenase